jgi:hypothetical protein
MNPGLSEPLEHPGLIGTERAAALQYKRNPRPWRPGVAAAAAGRSFERAVSGETTACAAASGVALAIGTLGAASGRGSLLSRLAMATLSYCMNQP